MKKKKRKKKDYRIEASKSRAYKLVQNFKSSFVPDKKKEHKKKLSRKNKIKEFSY